MPNFSKIKKMFLDAFSVPTFHPGILYFIIEELPSPKGSGIFTILCGDSELAFDMVMLNESGIIIMGELIGLHAATIRKYPYQKVEYVNVSPWAKEKIEARMSRIGLRI